MEQDTVGPVFLRTALLKSGHWDDAGRNGAAISMDYLSELQEMAPPRIKFLPEKDRRKPYPLSWEERLFSHLPEHLRLMALFKVNTGCREAEVCGLRWEWERPYPGLHTSVFVIPGERVKNRDDRVVVLNRAAFAVIEQVRGDHPEYVFTTRARASQWGRSIIQHGNEQGRLLG